MTESSRKTWDVITKGLVLVLWGLGAGSVVIWQTFEVVWPHIAEGGVTRVEAGLMIGLLIFGAAVAVPTVAMQLLGMLVEGVRAWRREDK